MTMASAFALILHLPLFLGAFPQDEYPEEVSTDEDDDEMFGSRKRMKREIGIGEKEEEKGAF